MIRGFVRFIAKRRFQAGMCLAIVFVLLLSYQRSSSYQQNPSPSGGSGADCTHVTGDYIELAFVVCPALAATAPPDSASSRVRFEPNVGQADSGYRFVAHGRAQSILLSGGEAVFALDASRQQNARTVHASLEGARSGAEPKAEQPLSGRVNYLIGRDRHKWHTDIPTFGRVTVPEIYSHIDVVYHGTGGELETDFVVRPGGDPTNIRIRFSGADAVQLGSDGALALRAEQRTLNWKKPLLYQAGAHGARNAVEGRFKFLSDGAVGFEVGDYDVTRPLVIDPVLTYATYFGGPYTEAGTRVAADDAGNAYMIGATDASSFPSTPGTYFSSANGLQGNVIVAKVAADGKSMVYETHIGGTGGDVGFGIALDAFGNVYLTGMTGSSDYPLVPASNNLTTQVATDPMNCFVTKLNAAGNALVYSTVIGGANYDGCSGVGVDSSGNAYVGGITYSTDFPMVNAVQTSFPIALGGTPSISAFMAKLSPDGTKLLYSTFYGGPGNNGVASLAVDSAGNAYFTGCTTSYNFPVTPGAYQTTFGGIGGQINAFYDTGDAFVVKLSPSGQKVYATYLGGSKDDVGIGIAIDSKGDAYVGGATLSSNFPTQNAFQATYHGAGGFSFVAGGDGFIAELDPTGSTLLFSSYIGGSADDRVLGVALDSSGNIWLAGHTISTDFPTAGTQAQPGYAGDNSVVVVGDAFLAEVNTQHALTFSTYLGGSGGDWAGGVAIDGTGGVIIVGGTSSSDFPVTKGVYQAQYGGTDLSAFAGMPVGDAFIAKFGGVIPTVTIAGISNAASYVGGAIAPGEAILIAGTNIGPSAIAGAELDPHGNVSTLVANTQFLFNGVAAPIVYVSAQYSSVMVPYEVSSSSTAQVVAVYNGTQSPAVTVPVVASLPGVFSANSSGTGQGAILNPNMTFNSAQLPASRGSIVTLFVTGEGQTNPAGIDGSVTASVIVPMLPVTVSFGGVQATVCPFIGEAPGEVAGVLQINVTIPQNAPTGSNVPVMVTVGTAASQAGLTMAIQ